MENTKTEPGHLTLLQAILDGKFKAYESDTDTDSRAKIFPRNYRGRRRTNTRTLQQGRCGKFGQRERYKNEDSRRNPREPVQLDEVSEIKTMSIFPSPSDLFGNKPELNKNIVTGAYESVDHYLKVQFTLLHEDFIAPLREGITEYLLRPKNSYSKKTSDIVVFRNVKILRASVDSGELGHVIKLDKKTNWAAVLQFFIFGSLLLFTTNDFKSFFLATVIKAENRNRSITVKLHRSHNAVCENIYSEEFVMATSKVFFEPYYHVLTALQNMTRLDFPMAKYIVQVEPQTKLPAYIQHLEHTTYTICKTQVNILDHSWPQFTSVKFNPSQHRAFQAALTNEFVVIQGPPGTGKTFLGHQIVTALLENAPKCTPILVVCFKNHALDQFLEGLIEKTKRIIRIGGRSKNKNLETFNLKNHRIKYGYALFEARLRALAREYFNMQNQLNVLKTYGIVGASNVLPYISCPRFKAEMMHTDYEEWLMEGVYVDQEIDILEDLDFENFHIGLDNRSESTNTEANGGVRQFETSGSLGKEDREIASASEGVTCSTQVDESRRRLEELYIDDYSSVYKDIDQESMTGKESRPWVSKNVAAVLSPFNTRTILQFTVAICGLKESCRTYEYMIQELLLETRPDDEYQQYRILAFQNNITDLKARIGFLNRMLPRKSKLNQEQAEQLYKISQFTVWSLTIRQRWELYHFWLDCLAKDIKMKMIQSEEAIRNLEEKLKEARNAADLSVLKRVDVVGMTTTGAARLRPMLNKLGARIVVIEEAAEVLESHIVTALSNRCQHVILIGDHKQLRPNPAVYQLCTKYNFDISLFERMVKNGMSCYTLDVQHRMRPKFASLIVPAVYPTLTDHLTTKGRPNILGVHHNLYFIHHNRHEEQMKDSVSHVNKYEAEYVVELSCYLVMQGYSTEQITILTTYSGQVKCIIKIREKYSPKLSNLRVTTVDDFQGEENKIIILSLVRSNKMKSIGFLKTENRVCVALSRARDGLYIIGNMDLLSENSEIWPKVKERLLQHNALGTSLTVYCQNHPETVMQAKNGSMFRSLGGPEGGCRRMCVAKLRCGHACTYHCHPCDQSHEYQYKCSLKCDRKICDRNHPCTKFCGETCLPCQVPTLYKLVCGHSVRDVCSGDPAKLKCTTELPCVWPLCGHNGTRYCGETVKKAWKRKHCQQLCGKSLDCGHACVENCHEEKIMLFHEIQINCTKVCRAPVEVELDCGHPVVTECCLVYPQRQPSLLENNQCHKMLVKMFPCGHSTSVPCSTFKSAQTCGVTVEKVLGCGHKQQMRCGIPTDSAICTELVTRVLPCRHKKEDICSAPLASLVCEERCVKVLPCGHPCPLKCSAKCVCTILLEKKLSCGHKARYMCAQETVICQQLCKRKLPCGHVCRAQCSLPCDPGKCMVLVEVQKRPACGHGPVTAPCLFNHIDSEAIASALVKYCKAVCRTLLACGHPCPGLCCSSKQQHAPCNSPCSKVFPCSHMCSQMCKDKCTPCYNKCLNRCSHKQCDGICGEPCSPCKEPCAWRCVHSRCTRTCSTFCDRQHCDFPCPKKLGCGHLCSGFCGEVCPRECLQCDPQADEGVEEMVSRLVVLEDCGHAVSAATMDSIFFRNLLRIVRCPVTTCQQPIVSTKRYRNQVRTVLNKIRNNKREVEAKNMEKLEFKEHSHAQVRNGPFRKANSHAPAASTRNKFLSKKL